MVRREVEGDDNVANCYKICALAKDGDKNGLDELLARGISVNCMVTMKIGNCAPIRYAAAVTILGAEGEIDAMELLLLHFGGYLYQATRGCALAGLFEKVEELIARSTDKYQLLNAAISGYAQGGYFEKVEEMYKRGAQIQMAYRALTSCGFTSSGSFTLYVLASINDPVLRKDLIRESGCSWNRSEAEAQSLAYWHDYLAEADKINKLMMKYELNYESAHQLRRGGESLRVLILQGWQKGSKLECFPRELFLHLLTFVTGLNAKEVAKLSKIICSITYTRTKANIDRLYKPSALFGSLYGYFGNHSKVLYQEKLAELEKRYQGSQNRIGLLSSD